MKATILFTLVFLQVAVASRGQHVDVDIEAKGAPIENAGRPSALGMI